MSDQEKRIQEIRERANAATAGEWEQANKSVRVKGTQLDYGCYKAAPTGFDGGICNCLGGGYQDGKKHPVNVQAVKNAEFISHARQDIPYLLDLLDQLQRERQEPEPPKIVERHRGSYKWVTCPKCKEEFPTSQPYTEKAMYCGACGQLIEMPWHKFCGCCGNPIATEPKGEHHD